MLEYLIEVFLGDVKYMLEFLIEVFLGEEVYARILN